jgi:hypothetical protein
VLPAVLRLSLTDFAMGEFLMIIANKQVEFGKKMKFALMIQV